MCIAYPGRVVAIDPAGALVETAGRRRRASTLLVDDVRTGDWVTVAAGTIVERLDPAEAAEIQRLLHAAEDASAARPPANDPARATTPRSP
jgi:hydrogenase assembly chaperone HypC/HupF